MKKTQLILLLLFWNADMKTTQIDIEFPIYKLIERHRQSLDQSANAILMNLLEKPLRDADLLPGPVLASQESPTPEAVDTDRSWYGKGVELAHGSQLCMLYAGNRYTALIDDGDWRVAGQTANSPSAAAMIAIQHSGHSKTSRLNGWNYWQVKRPGDLKWRPLNDLRPKKSGRPKAY